MILAILSSPRFWDHYWDFFFILIFVVFVIGEPTSIIIRKVYFGQSIFNWTLSDFMRRWMSLHHCAPALCIGFMAWFAYHIFIMSNS